MEEQVKSVKQPVRPQQNPNFLEEMRKEKIPEIHAGLLREHPVNRYLTQKGVGRSDARFETRYETYIDFKKVNVAAALEGLDFIGTLKVFKEVLLHESVANVSRLGLKSKRVLSEWNAKKAWIERFDSLIDNLASKQK